MPFPRGAFYATTILKIYYPNLAYNRLFEGGGCGGVEEVKRERVRKIIKGKGLTSIVTDL